MRVLGRALFGVQPLDPPSLAVAVLLIAVTAFVGAALPARSALRVDLIRTLRTQ